jgi:hypothetical protein
MVRMDVLQRKNSHGVQYLELLMNEPSPPRPIENMGIFLWHVGCIPIFAVFVTSLHNPLKTFEKISKSGITQTLNDFKNNGTT